MATAVIVSHRSADLLLAFNLAGTFIFGLGGGIAAVRRHLDLFGIVVIAVVVALTGGTVRDVLIGVAPRSFRDWRYLAAAAGGGAVCAVLGPFVERIGRVVRICDALGLSLFCVTGALAALDAGVPAVPAALLGMITGIGGGVLRDLMLGQIPTVLREQFYAMPGLLGAAVVAGAHTAGARGSGWPVLGACVCFTAWLAGTLLGWELPKGGLIGRREAP